MLKSYTILQFYKATVLRGGRIVHILDLAAETGCWTSTIYKAVSLGYLRRVDSAKYGPTDKLRREGREIELRARNLRRVS